MGVLILLLAMICTACLGFVWDFMQQERRRISASRKRQRLVQRLHAADREIREEARKARHAMNTAAGQNWRNRFE